MFEYKRNPYRDGLGDILTDCVSVELCAPHIYCFGGDGGGGDSGGSGSSPDPDPEPQGTIFGVDGVSKTGSTAQDAAIGYTSGEGSGEAGDNYDALQGATNTEVAQAVSMAEAGASTAEIGAVLAGDDAPAAGTIGTSSAGGNVESVVEETTQQAIGRPGTTAPDFVKSFFDNVTNTISGGSPSGIAAAQTVSGAVPEDVQAFDEAGFISAPLDDSAAAPNTLADTEAAIRRTERRGDYLTAPGGVSYNPPGYPEGMAVPFMQRSFYNEDAGGTVREMAPLTGSDITGVNRNTGLGASESGAFAVLTVEQMNDLGRSLNKKYGDDRFLGLGDLDPMQMETSFGRLFEAYPNQEYGRFDQRLGGQSIVRNPRLIGMNPKTGSVMLEGGNRGFFGSGIASIFGLMAGGPVSTGLSVGGTVNRAQNFAMDRDTGSLIGLGLDAAGLPGSAVNQGLRLAGVDVNRFLPQMEGSTASGTTMFAPESEPDVPLSIPRDGPDTAATQMPDAGISVSLPTTAATSLVKRKRLPGQDVYGVTGSEFPFLSLTEELETSGLSSAVKGRPGRFTQNRPR